MDTEGLGRELLLTPPRRPLETLKTRLWALRQHLTKCSQLQALWNSLNAGTATLQREAAWAEGRLFGDLQQSVPQNGRVHLHIIDGRLRQINVFVFLGRAFGQARLGTPNSSIIGRGLSASQVASNLSPQTTLKTFSALIT